MVRRRKKREPLSIQPTTAYAQGWHDGIEEMIKQIRNQSTEAPEGCFKGTVPFEMETWLLGVEERLKMING